jgi:hypothetical protein
LAIRSADTLWVPGLPIERETLSGQKGDPMPQSEMVKTSWERMTRREASVAGLLSGTHTLWSCSISGERIFTVLPNGETPTQETGGYISVDAALKAKGMLRD